MYKLRIGLVAYAANFWLVISKTAVKGMRAYLYSTGVCMYMCVTLLCNERVASTLHRVHWIYRVTYIITSACLMGRNAIYNRPTGVRSDLESAKYIILVLEVVSTCAHRKAQGETLSLVCPCHYHAEPSLFCGSPFDMKWLPSCAGRSTYM